MLTPKKLLGSAILCAALTAPTQASAPDEGTSTNSTTPTWTIDASNAAKLANASHPLMSLNRGTLTELCQILAENGHADAIANLGMSSIHMAGRILKPVGGYPGLFQDEDMRINNPDMRHAIRVELRKAIDAREEELASLQKEREDKPKSEPKAPLLAPWKELLGPNASLQHLIWALQMLQPANVEKLRKNGSLKELTRYRDKVKTLALGAAATQLFTEEMNEWHEGCIITAALPSSLPLLNYAALGAACKQHFFTEQMNGFSQAYIINAALNSSRVLSEYTVLSAACREHLFTEKTDGHLQARIICAALSSSRPVSEYKARGDTCRAHLFTAGMEEWDKADIISYVLPLSDTQMDQLVRECDVRLYDGGTSRRDFIQVKAWNLLARK